MLVSPIRAAGKPPIKTVALPIAIPFGAGETQTMPPGTAFATAAGIPPISTVATAAAGVIGPPTCGFGPSVSGQTTMSLARRAGPVGIPLAPISWFHHGRTRPAGLANHKRANVISLQGRAGCPYTYPLPCSFPYPPSGCHGHPTVPTVTAATDTPPGRPNAATQSGGQLMGARESVTREARY